jgi:hypothetical protein
MKLELSQSVQVANGIVFLERIERPTSNVPGNRPIYFLSFSRMDKGANSADVKESIRFDPFNSGKVYQFEHSTFSIFTNGKDDNSLLIQSIAADSK